MRHLYPLVRPLFFCMDAESIHDWMLGLFRCPGIPLVLRTLCAVPRHKDVNCLGLSFRNPVGLAAGFDKNAVALAVWEALGFGFVEVGTVTPRPQAGNDRPRIHRFPSQEALVNSMGFPNDGAQLIAHRLQAYRASHPEKRMLIGVNIGKNKETPNASAAEDYVSCLRQFYGLADFFVVNISSPNTQGLRDLQEPEALDALLEAIQAERDLLAHKRECRRPLLLKIAPDMDDSVIPQIIAIAKARGVDGLVATNTTRDHTSLDLPTPLPGGLSGAPLRHRSTQIIQLAREAAGPDWPIIASGGIFSDHDLREKAEAGAQLVEVYTGFVYRGPDIVAHLTAGL